MKIKLLFIIFFSLLLVSCNRREKQLERHLEEIENSFSESNDELYKALLQVQNLIDENNNLKNEIDDLKNENEKLIKRHESLAIKNNDLRNKKEDLSNKNKTKTISEKTQVKPSFTPKVTGEYSKINKVEKSISLTNNNTKTFLNECKNTVKEINDLLLNLKNVDEEKVDTKRWRGFKSTRQYKRNEQKYYRESRREITCRQIGNETTDFHYKIARKLKNLPEDNSTIQFRKILMSIDQNLKIIIDNNNAHKQATTKGEWDTCTYNALKAVENINNIINNNQYIK